MLATPEWPRPPHLLDATGVIQQRSPNACAKPEKPEPRDSASMDRHNQRPMAFGIAAAPPSRPHDSSMDSRRNRSNQTDGVSGETGLSHALGVSNSLWSPEMPGLVADWSSVRIEADARVQRNQRKMACDETCFDE